MKAYEYKQFENYDYPQEMETILDYLHKNGKLNISVKEVERQYRIFSHEQFSAGWMEIDDNLLSAFANYLSGVDI